MTIESQLGEIKGLIEKLVTMRAGAVISNISLTEGTTVDVVADKIEPQIKKKAKKKGKVKRKPPEEEEEKKEVVDDFFEEKVLTEDDIRDLFLQYIEKVNDKAKVKDLLTSYGAKKISDLDPVMYQEVSAKLKVMIADE